MMHATLRSSEPWLSTKPVTTALYCSQDAEDDAAGRPRKPRFGEAGFRFHASIPQVCRAPVGKGWLSICFPSWPAQYSGQFRLGQPVPGSYHQHMCLHRRLTSPLHCPSIHRPTPGCCARLCQGAIRQVCDARGEEGRQEGRRAQAHQEAQGVKGGACWVMVGCCGTELSCGMQGGASLRLEGQAHALPACSTHRCRLVYASHPAGHGQGGARWAGSGGERGGPQCDHPALVAMLPTPFPDTRSQLCLQHVSQWQ